MMAIQEVRNCRRLSLNIIILVVVENYTVDTQNPQCCWVIFGKKYSMGTQYRPDSSVHIKSDR